MFIKEKIESLGLSPDQTRQVYALITDCFQKGAAFMSAVLAPKANEDVLSVIASREATRIFIDRVESPETELFSSIYKVDAGELDKIFKLNFENELP